MAGKIKITDVSGTNIEGASDELTKFFKDNRCNLSDYLTPRKEKAIEKGKLWPIIVFGVLIVIVTIIIRLAGVNQIWNTILSIVLLGLFAALVLSTYLRWKWQAAIIIASIGVIMLLIAYGVMSPEDAAKDIKKNIEKIEPK